jgi:two-component system chemotaxis response regulator CheY
MRVLIADDQKSVGTSLAELVCYCHHEVVEVVGSGLEAIHAYTRHNPDVVLMDYWMSKLNGATACRNILAKDPAARVILVSAWAPAATELCDSGAVAILSKPVDLERLEEALSVAAQLPASDERAMPPDIGNLPTEPALDHLGELTLP